jgi:hypothetical protein
MDAMRLELSNFQPLAVNEAIDDGVPDLGGAEPLSEPKKKVVRGLLRSYAQSE